MTNRAPKNQEPVQEFRREGITFEEKSEMARQNGAIHYE
jgi:hypothetical protein